MTDDDYRSINLASWDERAPVHAASPDYSLARFVDDPAFISDVVRFDLPLLGDITGLHGVHLQCHIGTDTLSLSRLGAQMTGLDFSAAALHEARSLAGRVGADIEFVLGDVYSAVDLLGAERFDLVFTGIGALCWLPDVRRWAGVVSALLRPGGRLFIREGHPMLWALDVDDGALDLRYSYFERPEPMVFDEDGTYVSTEAGTTFEHNLTHEWNHGIGEILSAVLDSGMSITGLVEHQSVPWDALPGQMTQVGAGEYQLTDKPERLAHTYTLQAVKQGRAPSA